MFSRDCAEFLKALGSFDYACANKHLMRISKTHPSVGSICSRIVQCEGVYSSMQFLKPKIFRREDHLHQMYCDIAADVERESVVYRDILNMGSYGGASMESPENAGRAGPTLEQSGSPTPQGGALSGHGSPVLASEASQSSLHQYISSINNATSMVIGGARNAGDTGAHHSGSNNGHSSLSPTQVQHGSQHPHHQAGFNGREEQSAADHIVLYTILRELCSLRMALIGIYRLLSLSTVEIDIDLILPETELALQMYESGSSDIHNTVLGSGIESEISLLKHGLLMDKAVSEYDIQRSATHLHLARVALLDWQKFSSEQEYAEKSYYRPEESSSMWRYNIFSSNSSVSEEKSKSSTSLAKGKFNVQPNHLLWLHRWIASEKAKMTIYFMDLLLEKEQAFGGDERTLWANMDPDMHGIIRAFRKKAGAHSISFVYEISPDVRFSTTGFISANAPYESPAGLNSFPCIYSYPPEPPRDHWPNIISIMQGSVTILRQYRSQYFYDRKIGCTYYVARVDAHVSIVIIYLDKHPQPDTGAMDFLQLLAGKLRHTDVLLSMRQE
ncbi:hypothetical protein EC968_002382 [Mortierella alpina]|nr:hypothetical protein EC968_002382 [Mortierella alpina]